MNRAPDTLTRPHEWRQHAACVGAPDPEIWFPVGEGLRAQEQTTNAKRICHTCPAMTACLNWALETRQDSGIWGGLDERERRRIHRRKARGGIPPQPVRTLAGVFAERSTPGANGHTDWNGTTPVTINGTCYTAAQLAWHVTYGKAPDGSVSVECGHPGCVTAGHLMDAAARKERHGTPAAWQAHKRRGEDPCKECAEANRVAKRKWYESSPRCKAKESGPAPQAPRSRRTDACGTEAGYLVHRKWGEAACQRCADAHAEHKRQAAADAQAAADLPSLPTCGTRTGYDTHMARGEAPCRPCTDARARTDWLLRTTTPERGAA